MTEEHMLISVNGCCLLNLSKVISVYVLTLERNCVKTCDSGF